MAGIIMDQIGKAKECQIKQAVVKWKDEIEDKVDIGCAWIEEDMDNLVYNVRALKSILSVKSDIMAVVKADAYGHGAVEVARKLNEIGIQNFAVATLEEGKKLRRNGIIGDILVLGYTMPKEIPCLIQENLIQTVVDACYGEQLNQQKEKVRVHIKVNTGMNRIGENYKNRQAFDQLFSYENLKIEGMFTHLCVSDSLEAKDRLYTSHQIKHFFELIEYLKGKGHEIGKIHIQSSYGLLNYPELVCDYARIGIALYGALSRPKEKVRVDIELKPVLSIRCRIAMIRKIRAGETAGYGRAYYAQSERTIAVAAIGYADGIPRNLSQTGKAYFLVNGKKAPVIGRVCMDQILLDITDIPEVKQGDRVTVIGRDGDKVIKVEEVADWCATISNEILSRLGNRMKRIYI